MSNTISLANYERLAPVLDDAQFAAMVGPQGLDVDGGPAANKMHIDVANTKSGPQFDVSFGGQVPLHLTLDQLKTLNLAQYKVAPRSLPTLPPDSPAERMGYQTAESALQTVRAHRDPDLQLTLLKTQVANMPGRGGDVARGLLRALSQEDRVLLARTKSGRDMLAQAAQLAGDRSSADEVDAAARTADLAGSKEFKALDPNTMALVIEWLTNPMITNWPNANGSPVPGPNAVRILSDLVRSPAFGAASPDERNALFHGALERPGSEQMRLTLEKLTGLDAYKALTPKEKIQAIDDCAKVFQRYHRAGDPDVASPRAFPYQEIAVIRHATQKLEQAKPH